MSLLINNGSFLGRGSTGESIINDTALMAITPSVLTSILIQGDIPIQQVATDGNGAGTIYDQSPSALVLRQPTSLARPILGSDGTRNSYLTFNGTANFQIVQYSISIFRNLWASVPGGAICMWFKMNGGDGSSQTIMSSWGSATTNVGFNITRAAGGTLLCRGSDTTVRWTYSSVVTVTSASGWRGLIVSLNGVGASAGRGIVINSSGTVLEDATFAITAGSTANANHDLWIGARNSSGGDTFFNGSISALFIYSIAITDSLITLFSDYNPAKTSSEFTAIEQWIIDPDDTSYVYSDAGLSVPAVNDDPVRGFRSQAANGTLARRQATSASSGVSALYKTNIINGHAVLRFDGSNDTYSVSGVPQELFEERAGKWTCFFVVKNIDATFGSHIMSGNNYFVLTGSSYAGASGGNVNPYSIMHPEPDGGASVGTNTKGAGVDDFKVIAFRRNLTEICAWNGNKTKSTGTSTDRLSMSDIGVNHSGPGVDWHLNGDFAWFSKYNGSMTDAEVEAVIDILNARFGL